MHAWLVQFDINSDVGCIRVFTRIRPHAMDFLRRVSKVRWP